MFEARCVPVWAEEGDSVAGDVAEGFEALEGLLAVVEAGREAVDADVGRGDEFGFRPAACAVGEVGFDVPVYCGRQYM